MPAVQSAAESILDRILNIASTDIRSAVERLDRTELLLVLVDLAWTMMDVDAIDAAGIGDLKNTLVRVLEGARQSKER